MWRAAAVWALTRTCLGVVIDREAGGPEDVALKILVDGRVERLVVGVDDDDGELDAKARSFCRGRSDGCAEVTALAARRAIRVRRVEDAGDDDVFWTAPPGAIASLDLGSNATTVVTVATAATDGLRRLVASMVEFAPATLVVLGLGLPFIGTVQKIAWTRSYLRRSPPPPGGGVVFVDAYDTVFQRPVVVPAESVIFGADRVCSPDVCAGPLEAGRRFLNSGTYAGPVDLVADLLDLALAANWRSHRDSDQRLLSTTCLERPTRARLDDVEFAPLDGLDDVADAHFVVVDGRLERHGHGRPPAVVHGNGPQGKRRLDDLVRSRRLLNGDDPRRAKDDAVVDAAMAHLRVVATTSFLDDAGHPRTSDDDDDDDDDVPQRRRH